MKGDVILVDEEHRRAAEEIAGSLVDRIRLTTRRFVIAVAGESGSGKSETAVALAEAFGRFERKAVILGQDDYFVLPPRSNDARRRDDPAWLGPNVEVRMDVLQSNVDAAAAGVSEIEKPAVDYEADSIGSERLPLEGVSVVIVEGTYVSLLRNVDCRVFIARSRLETLEHRHRRNRGSEAHDPFVEGILETEHKIIAGHRFLADFVIAKDYTVTRVSREER